MRILYFSSRPCWPVNSGARLRDYHLARQLARKATVTYLGLTYPGETEYETPGEGLPAPAEIFERVVMITKARAFTPANLVRGLIGPTPVTVLNCTTAEIAATLDGLGRTGAFDAIQMEGVHLAQYVPVLRAFPKSPPLLCDCHNIESELMWRYSETVTSLPRRLYARRTAALMERTEIELLRAADTHTVVSEREAKKLRALVPEAPIHVIENGVDTAYHADAEIERAYLRWRGERQAADGARNRIVFAGSMDYHANIDAARHFAREIWPAIRERAPELRFTIVGRNPAPEVTALSALAAVEVTGTVPDMRPYYREALAVVVPLRIGSGTRLKILEAMAAGVPVVSTTLGAEGLDTLSGLDILVADTPADTADAIGLLRQRPETCTQLATAARALVARCYDWQALGERLLAIHQGAAERAASHL